ncbi:MAG: DegV family protein [Bacilli bacterium]|nr:DegV family protein [Bacilli bacterium]
MQNYILSCTSTVDISSEHLAQRDIHYLGFNFTLGKDNLKDDLGQSISFEDFYKRMAAGEMTKTSQPATGDYVEYFRPFLKEGKDIIHLCLSSGLSGDTNSARIASDMLKEEFPKRKIIVIDSLAASSGGGLLVDKLADLRDQGMDIDQLAAWAEEHKLEVHHWFFSTDLTYYVRGGRISRTSGFVGNLLHICPLLNVSNEGKLTGREKVHGVKNVEKRIVEKMEEFALKGLDYDEKVYISMSACPQYAEAVASKIEEKFTKMDGKVEINWIGTTIGAHTGPGTVALFFWGKKREN